MLCVVFVLCVLWCGEFDVCIMLIGLLWVCEFVLCFLDYIDSFIVFFGVLGFGE